MYAPERPSDAARLLSRNQQDNIQKWTDLFRRCRSEFTPYDEFDKLARALHSERPASSMAVADLLIRPRPQSGFLFSPITRDIMCLQRLYVLGIVRLQSVIGALLRYSSIHKHAAADPAILLPGPTPAVRYTNSFSHEEALLYLLTKTANDPKTIAFGQESLKVLDTLVEWMQLFTTASAAFAGAAMVGAADENARTEVEMTRVALLAVLIMVFDNENVLRTLSHPGSKAIRKRLSDGLKGFIPIVDSGSTAHMGARLKKFHDETLASFEPVEPPSLGHEDADKTMDDALGASQTWHEHLAISDLPIQTSRAGLYIYLNAALVGPPLIDDMSLFTYLHNRYGGHVQTAFVSLILASFDVLANAVFRNEGQESALVLRSYLINKVPVLLSHLAPSLYAAGITPEMCITRALADVDTNAFPTLSSMFDDTRQSNPFTDSVREDFIFACCLHGLVPRDSIEAILGESTYQTLPSGGKYTQEGLIQECLSDPDRASRLISELDLMDGNVGAVCLALTDLLGRMCANKETMSLKILCSQLVGRLVRLDVMLLFRKPSTILQPLCELLDSFTYDDDIGEYQPVYEEFGSVLLVVFAFVYRYGLTGWDLGIEHNSQSFVAQLIQSGHVSRPLAELGESDSEHLGRWIHGLSDTEAGGITDDLISSCPPQDFYRLVPTLFHQIVLGMAAGHISEESLKTGVEYLTETFLQPSLVTAMAFLAEQLHGDNEAEQKAILKLLHLILLSKPTSGEPSLLASVLSIVAGQLEPALRAHQRSKLQGNNDVQPLLQAIKDGKIVPSRRTGTADLKEVEAWVGTSNGGLTAMLGQIMQAFMKWSVNPGINVMPTSYTHRQVVLARESLGADRVLQVLLDEIKSHSDPSTVGIIYDVATSIICSADVVNGGMPESNPSSISRPRHDMTLRDALRSHALDCRRIFDTDPLLGEIIVRLYRRVEAQLAPAPQPDDAMLGDDVALALDMNVVGVPGELTDAMAAAAADMGGGMDLDAMQGLDLGMGQAVGGDVDLGAAAGTAANMGADPEVFLDLGPLDDWDSMDVVA